MAPNELHLSLFRNMHIGFYVRGDHEDKQEKSSQFRTGAVYKEAYRWVPIPTAHGRKEIKDDRRSEDIKINSYSLPPNNYIE